MATDEIRALLAQAREQDNLTRAMGGETPNDLSQLYRSEALTLAICDLLDSGLVLATPEEIASEVAERCPACDGNPHTRLVFADAPTVLTCGNGHSWHEGDAHLIDGG